MLRSHYTNTGNTIINAEEIADIGRYQLQRVLGEGASGIVYRAYDPVLDRTVAIKSAKPDEMTPEEIRRVVDEFHHEARVAGKFAHENVVAIYDIVSAHDLDHIVMEYVPGRSIMDYLKSIGPMNVTDVLSIINRCAVGLAYIHYQGVIHRDIKPGNILYHHADRVVKLMDFSIAHSIESPTPADNGSIAYMAPEHFDPNRRITPLTDIFALGATMYRMLVKQYPFSRNDTVSQILHQEPRPVTELRSEIPFEVGELVRKAMAKQDADRFQSAADFAHQIVRVMQACYPGSRITAQSDIYLAA